MLQTCIKQKDISFTEKIRLHILFTIKYYIINYILKRLYIIQNIPYTEKKGLYLGFNLRTREHSYCNCLNIIDM